MSMIQKKSQRITIATTIIICTKKRNVHSTNPSIYAAFTANINRVRFIDDDNIIQQQQQQQQQ